MNERAAAILLSSLALAACRGPAETIPGMPAGAPPSSRDAPRVTTSARLVATLLEPFVDPAAATQKGSVGTVEGVARWEGSTPLRVKQLTNDVDVAACGQRVNPGSMVATAKGEIGNVVIELWPLDAPRRGPADRLAEPVSEPVGAVISRCVQAPHVLVIPLGAGVEVVNDDDALHELASLSVRNPPFEASLPRYRRHADVPAVELARPERIQVTCRTHPWAVSWWVVTGARHHALTDGGGRFRLAGVPAGTWRLVAWHEEFGEQQLTVDVRANGVTTQDVAWR